MSGPVHHTFQTPVGAPLAGNRRPAQLSTLVRRHAALEAGCATALARRDQLSKAVCARATPASRLTDLSLADFRERRSLVAGAIHAGLATSARDFVARLTARETRELQLIERRLARLQYRLQETEREILERRPATVEGAVAKLRFISACLIDSQDLDQDHFAYLVEECAEVLAETCAPGAPRPHAVRYSPAAENALPCC